MPRWRTSYGVVIRDSEGATVDVSTKRAQDLQRCNTLGTAGRLALQRASAAPPAPALQSSSRAAHVHPPCQANRWHQKWVVVVRRERQSLVRRLKQLGTQMPKYSKKASDRVERAMRERKEGTLRSGGSGKRVTSRKQAIAIGLSEARRAGAKVPRRRWSTRSRSSSKSL